MGMFVVQQQAAAQGMLVEMQGLAVEALHHSQQAA